MVIYVWEDGYWVYEWDVHLRDRKPSHAKRIDLDKWYDYDLNEKEVLACLEAIGEER